MPLINSRFNKLNFLIGLVALTVAGTGSPRLALAQSVIVWEQPAASASSNDIRAAADNSEVLYALNGGEALSVLGIQFAGGTFDNLPACLLYTSPSPRD